MTKTVSFEANFKRKFYFSILKISRFGYFRNPDDRSNQYNSNGKNECVDIDECKEGSHKCAKNAVCTNTIGHYSQV